MNQLVGQEKTCFIPAQRNLGSSFHVVGFVFLIVLACVPVFGQSVEQAGTPAIVRPGAPGQASTRLPSDTTPKLTPTSPKNIEFMQGMIHHHAQAVAMVALIDSRTENNDVALIGDRITRSQADEIEFMQRWLKARGESTEMMMKADSASHSHGSHGSSASMQMPGMLTSKQMDALGKATGTDFDNLFLTGMIQHHEGAIVMVKDLFDTPGAGQDAELFNFASDVDSGQRAEIRIMQTLLEKLQQKK